MMSNGACRTGAAHSACLDESGAVLAWRSADPGLHVQEVGGPLAGKRVVSISAGEPSSHTRVPHRSDPPQAVGWIKAGLLFVNFGKPASTMVMTAAQASTAQQQ